MKSPKHARPPAVPSAHQQRADEVQANADRAQQFAEDLHPQRDAAGQEPNATPMKLNIAPTKPPGAGKGSYEDPRVYKLDLFERPPTEAAEILRRYLARERVENGDELRRRALVVGPLAG